jgi:tRNA U34 5-methylaminomethyl-2-thiouridine-forming methyltransferase MnmC
MPIPVRRKLLSSVDNFQIQTTDDGSLTLRRDDTNAVYHSESGAETETRHVYLLNSGIENRLNSRLPCRVLEIGLGTAMGMLLTLDLAIQTGTPLSYVAIENDWIDATILNQLRLQDGLSTAGLANRFIDFRSLHCDARIGDSPAWRPSPQHELVVHLADAVHWELPSKALLFDAIYFDPFAPAVAAELWSETALRKMRRMLKPGGKLATYCVSRMVRENMTAAGFDVRRVQGPPGGKRQVLVATLA